jgi:restriction system protein
MLLLDQKGGVMPQSRKQREADDKWMQSAAMFFALLSATVVVIKTRSVVLAVVVFVAVLATLGMLIVAAARLGSRRLARSGMGEIDLMSGEEFESFLRALFAQKGYVANLTPNGADFGADLTLEKGGERTAVQAKHWRNRDVGVKAVQEITAAKGYYRADRALVVITGSFTKQAIDLAKANGVELWDRRDLAREIAGTSPRPQ